MLLTAACGPVSEFMPFGLAVTTRRRPLLAVTASHRVNPAGARFRRLLFIILVTFDIRINGWCAFQRAGFLVMVSCSECVIGHMPELQGFGVQHSVSESLNVVTSSKIRRNGAPQNIIEVVFPNLN